MRFKKLASRVALAFLLAPAALSAEPSLPPRSPTLPRPPAGFKPAPAEIEAIFQKSLTNPNDLYFVRTARNTTAVIDRAETYDYQTSPMLNKDGTKDIYYCGGGGGHDSVYRARLSADNKLISGPTLMVPPASVTTVPPDSYEGVPDGLYACDVSVIKHGYPEVAWPGGEIDTPGEELLYLYYECAPFVTARGSTPPGRVLAGPTEICLAASADGGTSWMKYSSALAPEHFGSLTTVPTPVVEKNPVVTNDICNWVYGESPFTGEYVVDVSPDPEDPLGYPYCDNWDLAYASGHPSAISMPTEDPLDGDQREVWLYYYDSRGVWNDRGLTLVKSEDGLEFGEPIDLWAIDPDTGDILLDENDDPLRIPGPAKVRYYNVNVAGHDGVFIATGSYYVNYFSYSFDGIHWVSAWAGNGTPDPALRLAEVRSDPDDLDADMCVSPGNQGVLADKYGWVDRLTDVEFFVGEGKLSSGEYGSPSGYPVNCYDEIENEDGGDEDQGTRGYTWGIYSMRGNFGELIRDTVVDACDHYDGKNVRDQHQRGESPSMTQDEIYWIDGGYRYSYSSWQDFLDKNLNDPNAFLDISPDSFVRVLSDCTSGGVRPTAPVIASSDSATVAKAMAVNIPVLANDTGSINESTVVQVAAPSHGSLSIAGSGVITYTHNGDGATSDSFTYKVKDDAAVYSNTATVSVAIAAPSTLYRVNAGGPALSGGWAEDRTWASGGIPSSRSNVAAMGDATFAVGTTINVTHSSLPSGPPADMFKDERYDPSGSSPEMSWSFPVNSGEMFEARLYFSENYESAANGRIFSVSAEGSACTNITNLDIFVAAGNTKYKGIMKSCKVMVTDGSLDFSFATNVNGPTVQGIEILGLPLVDEPPVAVADSAVTVKGLATKVAVLANDTHDSSPAVTFGTVTVVNAPAHGSTSVSGGVITYTHNNDSATTDRFSYKVTDSNGVVSNLAVVTVTIKTKTLLYRVNAGGTSQTQSGGNWAADVAGTPSGYVNVGSDPGEIGDDVFSVLGAVTVDGTVPAGTNAAIFKSHRYDQSALPVMTWTFPISIGTGPQVEVNLYFAENYFTAAHQRKFNVKVEGTQVLTNFDIYGEVGALGTMRQFHASTDGSLEIKILPGSATLGQINAIEIYGPVP